MLNIKTTNKPTLCGSNLIISIYLFSALTGLFLLAIHEDYTAFASRENPYLVLFFLACVIISTYPVTTMKSESFQHISLPNAKKTKAISYITLFLSLYSILFFIPVLLEIYRYDDKANFRYLLADGYHPFIESSLFNSTAGVIATFYIIPMCLGLVNLILKNTKTGVLLILSSLSYPVFLLSYLGRDGVLFWSLSFIIAFAVIQNSFEKSTQKKLKIYGYCIVVIFIIAFSIITIKRFGSDGALKSITDYFGQPIINLSKVYGENIPHSNGATSNAPIYTNLSDNFFNESFLNQKLDRLDSPIWVFGTYLKQLYIDYGTLGTICIISALSVVSFFYTNRSKDLGTYIFYVFYTTFVAQSIFYFRHYNNAGHIYLIFIFLICASISYTSTKKRTTAQKIHMPPQHS